MRLLLDECVDSRIAAALRMRGYDVELVQEIDPSADDPEVLSHANVRQRLLVTTDLDFGELLVRTGLRSPGVVLLRLEGVSPERVAERIDTALKFHASALAGHLLVVDRQRDRLRRLSAAPMMP